MSNPRLIALIAVSACVSLGLHLAFAFLLVHGLPGNWWVAAVAVILFSSLYGLCALGGVVVTERRLLYLMIGSITASICVMGFSWPALCGFVAEFFGFAVFTFAVQREAANRIRLSLAHVMAYTSTIGIALGLVAVSCIFYGVMNANVSSGKFQESIVSAGVTVFNDAARVAIRSYTPSMTVDDLIRQQLPTPTDLVRDINLSAVPASTVSDLTQRLSDAGIDPERIDLNAVISNRTLQEQALTAQVDQKFQELSQDIVAASRQQVADSIGMPLTGSERVEDAVHDLLAQRIARFTLPQLRFVPLILAATFFLTLLLFNWLFVLLAILCARFLLFIGVHANVIVTVEVTVKATRYRFK